MAKVLKSVRIKSNSICYGPKPDANDEVEQHLTIAATGRIWFSARNFNQYLNEDGGCRKRRLV